MIRFEHVTKMLAGESILDDVSFEIANGETFVLVGASGAGKSVTLKHMVRLMTPEEGQVFVDDECVSAAEGETLASIRERFGYLFQGGAMLAWLNVEENVALPLRENTTMSDDEILARVYEMLKMVDMEDHGAKLPSEISGGMRKRAALARAIVHNPKIVLYDEPTSGLDPVSARLIDSLIEQLRIDLNVTSVVVTHDLHSALSIGTTVAMLHEGRIVASGSPDEFVKSSVQVVQDFLRSQFITEAGTWERTLR